MSIPQETHRFESGQWTEVTFTVVLVGQAVPPGWLPPAEG
jgi:hypothetical protein